MSQRARSLPLQTKASLTLWIVVAGFTVLSYVILRTVIAPAFDKLEMDAAATDLIRAERAMQADIENLSALTADWAPWDDIHDYVRGENPAFRKSNLDRPTLVNLELDFMAVFALDGKMMWSQVLTGTEEHPVSDLKILNADNPMSAALAHHETSASRTLGIVQTGLGPALISSRPIVRSDDSGPVSGALVMGQFLDDARLQRLRERTEVAVSWFLTDDPDAAAEEFDAAALSPDATRTRVSETSITSYKVLNDINANPLLLVETVTPRHISALGTKTVNVGIVFLGIAGVLVTIAVSLLVRGLVRQFDNMTTEVHDTRQALLDQSFKAGKADTAAEVLHNIRNAMTPMINGLDRLAKAFNVAGNLRVEKALAEIADPACAPERREKFLQYLDASFKRIEETNGVASEDLNIVVSQARQVEAILSDQERFANVAPVAESLPVDELVTEASHVIPKSADSKVQLEIGDSLAEFHVRAHKSGLLQVLGNLMLNAFESIQRAEKHAGEIKLEASNTVLDDKPMIRLTVRDNGRGFNEETGRRIFQRGFTSKKKGDINGLGLHWCANAVAGMGGRIVAESRGDGLGAEFHVLLPAAQEA